VVREQAQHLPARVAARTGHRHSDRHMHDHTYLCGAMRNPPCRSYGEPYARRRRH
jgi:hypothetical protein